MSEESMFQERLRFLEREPISNKNPTTGTLIMYRGDEVEYEAKPSNIINLARWRADHA